MNEIKHLQPGDYVCLEGDDGYSNPLRVEGVRGKRVWVESDELDISMLSPIPVTAEALIANGFRRNGVYNDILYNPQNLFIGYATDRGTLRVVSDVDGKHQDMYVHVKYLHEVQQALRVMGLDYIADDFKLQ